jgi:fused signal recognition particle receptor
MMGTPEILTLIAGIAAVVLGVAFILLRRRRRRAAGTAPAGADKRDARRTLRATLAPMRKTLLDRLQDVWTGQASDNARQAALEELLLTADVGIRATSMLLAKVRRRLDQLPDAESLRAALRKEMRDALAGPSDAVSASARPYVILVAGVNGVGKTTTIGKLARLYISAGRKVLLVAADTFRAAAGEQIQLWADRVGADCVRHQGGTDPSAVAFDGIKAAIARDVDIVIVDTAGRLHVKANLIEELKKIVRVINRQLEGAPHETLLVIDATTGQNALNQARVFQEALSLSGIVLTKLDGTAKGGIVFAIRAELGVPIRYIGYGEGAEDLVPFDADAFVDALLEPAGEDRKST